MEVHSNRKQRGLLTFRVYPFLWLMRCYRVQLQDTTPSSSRLQLSGKRRCLVDGEDEQGLAVVGPNGSANSSSRHPKRGCLLEQEEGELTQRQPPQGLSSSQRTVLDGDGEERGNTSPPPPPYCGMDLICESGSSNGQEEDSTASQ